MTERRANPYGYTEARQNRWIDAAMVILAIGWATSAGVIVGRIIYILVFA